MLERAFVSAEVLEGQNQINSGFLPHDITWGDTKLAFKLVRSESIPAVFHGISRPIDLYVGELAYRPRGNGEIKISSLSQIPPSGKQVLFTGSETGFHAYDPLQDGRNDPFYVIALKVDELRKDMSRLSALYHELGHVMLYDTNADVHVFERALKGESAHGLSVSMADAYSRKLLQSISPGMQMQRPHTTRENLFEIGRYNRSFTREIKLFYERNAWAAGMRLARKHGYPTGFENSAALSAYARENLSTYGKKYEDERFVNGWARPQRMGQDSASI